MQVNSTVEVGGMATVNEGTTEFERPLSKARMNDDDE